MLDRRIRGETEEGQGAAEGPPGGKAQVPAEGRELAGLSGETVLRPKSNRSLTVAARIGVAVASIRAATARERFPERSQTLRNQRLKPQLPASRLPAIPPSGLRPPGRLFPPS